jgi:hypothetical protein
MEVSALHGRHRKDGAAEPQTDPRPAAPWLNS